MLLSIADFITILEQDLVLFGGDAKNKSGKVAFYQETNGPCDRLKESEELHPQGCPLTRGLLLVRPTKMLNKSILRAKISLS